MSTLTENRPRRAWWHWRSVRLPSSAVLLETGVIGLAAAIFLVLGRQYAAPPLVAIDEGGLAFGRALRSPQMDALFNALTSFGAEALWFIWPPVVVLLLALRRLPSAVAIIVVAVAVYVWNDGLKAIYQRARPTELEGVLGVQSFSFPSGHAMAAGAVFGILALVAWRELRGPARWAAVAVCVGLPLCVAFSRVYLGVHYPTDVLAGLLAGALWADVVALVWRFAARTTREMSNRTSDLH